MRIILIGFMGSGKTTLGKKIANKLSLPFIDSDQEISKMESKSINALFEELGESGFRKLESDYIKGLDALSTEYVLSTGGGLPCFNNNMETLNELGTTIYIQMSHKAISTRLKNEKNTRPLIKNLSNADFETYIESTLKEREKYYLKADLIFQGLNANTQAIDNLIQKIHSK